MCLFQDCDQPDVLFSHGEEWREHMKQHYKFWRCPSHRDFGAFASQHDYIEHIRQAHETSLSDIQVRALANRNSRTTAKLFQICPLCGEDGTHGQMENHVTGHLRSLALKSLPSYQNATSEDGVSSNDSVGGSRPQSRSTIKDFMAIEVALELDEDDSELVKQANQSNAKNFLGKAHLDLGKLSIDEEGWDSIRWEGLSYNRMNWNPEDDNILQSLLLEKRKQDAMWVQIRLESQKSQRLT